MNKSISSFFIFGLLLTMLIPFAMMDAYALGNPGDMYASTRRASATPGAVFEVSQTGPLVETLVGDPTAGTEGLPGLAFDSSGQLFATTADGGGIPSNLLKIDQITGAVIQDFGIIEDPSGAQIKIADLSVQPGTNTIFGVTSAGDINFGSGFLFTISQTSPPIATPVGVFNGLNNDETPIGFAPDGTLYMTCFACPSISGGGNQLLTVSPTTGAILTQVSHTSSIGFAGLGVRGDGTIFGAAGGGNTGGPAGIYTISATGTATLVGNSVEGFTDLDFIPDIAVGGSDVSINTSALLLAGVESISMWMIPVVIAGIGIGVFVIKRRN